MRKTIRFSNTFEHREKFVYVGLIVLPRIPRVAPSLSVRWIANRPDHRFYIQPTRCSSKSCYIMQKHCFYKHTCRVVPFTLHSFIILVTIFTGVNYRCRSWCRDDTKNGCLGDYRCHSTNKCQCSSSQLFGTDIDCLSISPFYSHSWPPGL